MEHFEADRQIIASLKIEVVIGRQILVVLKDVESMKETIQQIECDCPVCEGCEIGLAKLTLNGKAETIVFALTEISKCLQRDLLKYLKEGVVNIHHKIKKAQIIIGFVWLNQVEHQLKKLEQKVLSRH